MLAIPRRFLALSAVVLSSVSLQGQFTYLGSGDWDTAANWSHSTNNGEVPGTNLDQQAEINGGSTVTLDTAEPSIRALRLEGGSGTAILNINAGAVIDFTTATNWDSSIGRDGANGVVNQTGGDIEINFLELGRDNGTTGEYYLSGGILTIARGGRADETEGASLIVGTDDGSSTGGTATGLIEISGGAFVTRSGVWLGGTNGSADATFSVLGSEASEVGIASDNTTDDGFWIQNTGSTLNVGIDTGGVTTILIDDGSSDDGTSAIFESGSFLNVDYYNITEGGGTWTVMEVENGDIIDNGLSFSPGVDTSIWSFTVDNSGANGRLLVSAVGDPIGFPITIGNTLQQKMRFGMDYERLWFWTNSLNSSERDDVARWSAVDTDIDYVRVAMNSGYELTEGDFDLSAYTNRIIPVMQEMKEANPNIKFFASPRPLDEAQDNVNWQPYPQWVTGSTGNNTNYNLNNEKCADYIERYILLMKSYGFQISFLDLTNEWDTSGRGGGAMSSGDVRDITEDLKSRLDPEDMPLIIAPSAYSYSQGDSWMDSVNTNRRRDAIDIAASHNTGRSGDAVDFAENVRNTLGNDTEIWNTEVHGWKSTSNENETVSFYYYLEAIRAGFGGINGWLAIGTTNQGHSYILNPNGTPVRNVKYYIFRKLSSTSNYGYALDILEEPNASVLADTSNDYDSERNVVAFIKGNLMTVWVINEHTSALPVVITPSGYSIGENAVRRTRWTDPSDVEGFETFEPVISNTSFASTIPGESVCCFEIVLDTESFEATRIEAEDFSHQWRLDTEATGDVDGDENVCHTNDGDWLRFGAVALTGDSTLNFRVARPSGRPDSKIEIREGSADGPVLGEVAVPVTGNWQNYQTVATTLNVDEGIYNLYLKFVEDSAAPTNAFLMNFNWFSVNEDIIEEPNPVPVTGLVATAVTTSGIDLSWDPLSTASSYTVMRSLVSGGPYTSVVSGLTVTSFSDQSLESGTPYYYVVNADFVGDLGPDSSEVSAVTIPVPPASLTATGAGATQIDLVWSDVPNAVGYFIRRSETEGGPYTTVSFQSTGITEWSDTGLTPGTVYYYVIHSAVTAEAQSVASVEASASTVVIEILPENLRIGSIDFGKDDETGSEQLTFTIEESGLGQIYQLYSSKTLAEDSWLPLGEAYSGTGGLLELDVLFDYSDPANGKEFFRVEVSVD